MVPPHLVPHAHRRESKAVRGLLEPSRLLQELAADAYIRRLENLSQKRILAKRSGSQVVHNRPDPQRTDEFGQVLAFRRRPGQRRVSASFARSGGPDTGLADDLAQYEQEPDEPIDYRQRMLMNMIAIAIVTVLVGAGVWITDTITDLDKDQDCVMQGRGNCAPIEVPAPNRQ
jgi:hypothetical protein